MLQLQRETWGGNPAGRVLGRPTFWFDSGQTVSGSGVPSRCSSSAGSSTQCTPWSMRRTFRWFIVSQMFCASPSSPAWSHANPLSRSTPGASLFLGSPDALQPLTGKGYGAVRSSQIASLTMASGALPGTKSLRSTLRDGPV